jgi:hypothetical protein
MGGTSSQQTQQSQTSQVTPYAPAQQTLNGLLGQIGNTNTALTGTESSALNQLGSTGGNSFAPQIADSAGGLLNGGGAMDQSGAVSAANTQYQNALNPFASGQYVDPSQNSALQKYLQVARDDATNSINGQFAGAGRDLSGANSMALGRGIGQAEAPILYDAYNQARNQQLGAIQGQFTGAQGTAGLLGNMQQAANQNQLAGTQQAGAATDAKNSGAMMQRGWYSMVVPL